MQAVYWIEYFQKYIKNRMSYEINQGRTIGIQNNLLRFCVFNVYTFEYTKCLRALSFPALFTLSIEIYTHQGTWYKGIVSRKDGFWRAELFNLYWILDSWRTYFNDVIPWIP